MTREKELGEQHSRTRSDHATELAEDYVEAIADQIEKAGCCRAVDLAHRFGVSGPSVTRTVARLQRDGFVTTAPYAPIELTEQGRELAVRAKHRHQVVLRFLIAIGVTEETAINDSEGIEHHVSDETLGAMQQWLSRNDVP